MDHQIAHGTFSPIEGFMDFKTVKCVIDQYELPSGEIWTMPILLPLLGQRVDKDILDKELVLVDEIGIMNAKIQVSEVFELDLKKLALSWFGTDSKNHPGVDKIYKEGNTFIAEKITLLNDNNAQKNIMLISLQSRYLFSERLVYTIGFHTRNPIHRAHEYIQKKH